MAALLDSLSWWGHGGSCRPAAGGWVPCCRSEPLLVYPLKPGLEHTTSVCGAGLWCLPGRVLTASPADGLEEAAAGLTTESPTLRKGRPALWGRRSHVQRRGCCSVGLRALGPLCVRLGGRASDRCPEAVLATGGRLPAALPAVRCLAGLDSENSPAALLRQPRAA